MSVDLGFHGIVEPNEEYRKKYAAFKACEEANIKIPDELWSYFGNNWPNPSGLEIKIDSELVALDCGVVVKEIDLKKLRPDITKIQVYLY